MHRLFGLILSLIVAGCANLPVPQTSNAALSAKLPACTSFFDRLEQRIADANALNAGSERIDGFPGLRTDRLLASFTSEIDSPAERESFVQRLRTIDQIYRRHEIEVLGGTDGDALIARSDSCGDALVQTIAADPLISARLIDAVEAPDHYADGRRVIGVYPVVRPFILAGVERWQRQARAAFSNDSPVAPGVQYWPPGGHVVELPFPLQNDALGIPIVSPASAEALFANHAPVFEINSGTNDDRIGAPTMSAGRAGVDTESPTVFEWLSYTRFAGEVLLQLNYVVWFPARTKTGPLDLYGGRFDGLNFRVTLDTDGAPLLFESIHNCGCYYKAYLTDRLTTRSDIAFAEPPLILSAPDTGAGQDRIVVSMTPVAHYVNRIYTATAPATAAVQYQREAYAELFSLPGVEGPRNLFDERGLLPGSERLEGYLLWPSGVLAPGAMRQWGTHAIAFVGERHFDDAYMLDAMFERAVSAD